MRLCASTLALPLMLALAVSGCVRYEYEHELWLKTDGSGSLRVTGRPALWAAYKGLGSVEDPAQTISREALRRLFESSGLRVRRATRTRRGGEIYLFVAADFKDVNALSGTPAFADMSIQLRPVGQQLVLEGAWMRPSGFRALPGEPPQGLMAVRVHLPSKVQEHRNAFAGVERGNIVSWRQSVAQGLAGQPLAFGAVMHRQSILMATLTLFLQAILLALAVVALLLYFAYRRGQRLLAAEAQAQRRDG
jgi:hypothetical protein